MAQGAGQVGLAVPACSSDKNIFTATDPGDIPKHGELLFGEVSSSSAVDILEGDGIAQFAEVEVYFHAPALPVMAFGVDESGDEFMGIRMLVERSG